MQKIRRDDEIIVIAGKDKGKRGKVLKVLADDRLVIGGVNLVKRHTKPNPMAGVQGGIVEKEAPLHASNVAIFNGARIYHLASFITINEAKEKPICRC